MSQLGALGFEGNAGRVYALLDSDNSGYVTLEEIVRTVWENDDE